MCTLPTNRPPPYNFGIINQIDEEENPDGPIENQEVKNNNVVLPFDNKAKDEENSCILCCENEKNTVILPCHHMISCIDCTNKINKCPICQVKIKKKISLFT